jgi:hypothetical protein
MRRRLAFVRKVEGNAGATPGFSGRGEVEVREETLSGARCLGKGGSLAAFKNLTELSQTAASLKIEMQACLSWQSPISPCKWQWPPSSHHHPDARDDLRGPGPFVLFTELDPAHLALINDYAQVFLLFLCSPAVFFCLPGLPQEFFLKKRLWSFTESSRKGRKVKFSPQQLLITA